MWHGYDWFAALLASRDVALLAGVAIDSFAVCTYDLHGYLAADIHARFISETLE